MSSRAWAARVAAGAVALIVLAAGCGYGDADDTSSEPSRRSGGTTSATASPAPEAVPALLGTWRADPITLEDAEATLRRQGLGRWVEDFRSNAPFTEETVLTLTVEDGAWDLYGKSGRRPPEPIDYDAEYEIDGDTVVFHHSNGSNTYRWQVEGDTLRLEFVESTLPGYRGIPDEVFQRALYMTVPFTRQG